jgi:hypothetical protein
MDEQDLNIILQRDKERRAQRNKIRKTPEFEALYEISQKILYAPGINNGNIYADDLAIKLIEAGVEIKNQI